MRGFASAAGRRLAWSVRRPMPSCPRCGALIPQAQTTCQGCGINIRSIDENIPNSPTPKALVEVLVLVATFAFGALLLYIFQ